MKRCDISAILPTFKREESAESILHSLLLAPESHYRWQTCLGADFLSLTFVIQRLNQWASYSHGWEFKPTLSSFSLKPHLNNTDLWRSGAFSPWLGDSGAWKLEGISRDLISLRGPRCGWCTCPASCLIQQPGPLDSSPALAREVQSSNVNQARRLGPVPPGSG